MSVLFSYPLSNLTNQTTGLLPLITILVLFVLLYQKELTTTSQSSSVQKLGAILNVAIVPLLIAFILIAFFAVAQYL